MAAVIPIFTITILLSIAVSNGIVRKPKNSAEFSAFLGKVRAGDVIELEPTTYIGEFLVNQSSEIPEFPITLRGSTAGNMKTTLSNPDGTVLSVNASNYIFRTMLITNSPRALLIDGNGIELDGLTIKDCKEGILLSSGQKHKLQALTITNVEAGIVIGPTADHVTLQHSSITSGNVSLEIQSNSCCSVLDNNVFNGYVNLFGNGNKLNSNVANGGLLVRGCFNEFTSNVVLQMKLTRKCSNPDKGLNIFQNSPDQNFE